MNEINQYMLGIYQVGMIVRDTLEYAMSNRPHDVKAYEERINGFKILLAEGAPLPLFVKNNGEKSLKIMENLNNLVESVYSDSSTIVRRGEEGLRVDDAQHIAIYEQVVGIYQTIADIMNGYIQYTKQEDLFDPRVAELIAADELFFRLYAHLTIMNDIIKHFGEFNKIMNENKGQPNPLANFIVEDLKKLYGFIGFQKQHNKVTNSDYNEAVDQCAAAIDMMNGRRALPEGKTFDDIFAQLNQNLVRQIGPAELAWRAQFKLVMEAALEAVKNKQKKEDLA